ncbi:hypothetical protein AB3S75_000400 [Citrus x aurantiifolia]
MGKTSLPPGFRFHPTDVELIKYYLKRKVMGRKFGFEAIAEVDIYKHAPWDLPDKSSLRSGDLKWYFFCPREKKYANGARMNRATEFGYWKTTGKDRPVQYNNEVVGMIKTLVFHRGKAPRGDRTDWVMHEYRIDEPGLSERGVVQDAYVLCIVFQKDGPGPRNGAQYGAPFREEDWENDEDVDCVDVISSAVLPPPVPSQNSPVAESSHIPERLCIGTSESCLSDTIPPTSNMLPPVPVINDVSREVAQDLSEDDILAMLAYFTEDNNLISNENGQIEQYDNVHDGNIEASPRLDGVDIYNDLGDLENMVGFSGGEYDFFPAENSNYNLDGAILGDNASFIELHDLDAPLNCPAEACEPEQAHCNGPYTDQKCYNSEQSCYNVNPCFSQSPSMLPQDSVQRNANEAPLNHGAAKLSVGSSRASEDSRSGGSHCP